MEGAFEAGLSDYAAVRSDPDLDAVRGPELDKLMSKCVLNHMCWVPIGAHIHPCTRPDVQYHYSVRTSPVSGGVNS